MKRLFRFLQRPRNIKKELQRRYSHLHIMHNESCANCKNFRAIDQQEVSTINLYVKDEREYLDILASFAPYIKFDGGPTQTTAEKNAGLGMKYHLILSAQKVEKEE